MQGSLDTHYQLILQAITNGRLIPLLGAGVNLCGRPIGKIWQRGNSLPSGGELSAYLAEKFAYPDTDKWDLVRVSQYIAVVTGSGPLYEELHKLFNINYEPTPLHQFLATLPGALRTKGYAPNSQLIVTTNYDDVLERAFRAANESFDVVTYITTGEYRGKFWHLPPDADRAILIKRPNEYRGVSPDKRTVILKIHGAVDRVDADHDSYVITEDDYIDYLTRTELSSLVPVTLAAKLKKSNFLFLGYGLRDWNLRVILHRIWGQQKLNYSSWAIQLNPPPIDQKLWSKRDVEVLSVDLATYIEGLRARIELLPPNTS